MTDQKRRRLPSLEPAIRAYSTKAWYTVPSAHTTHGVDPNAPREPGYFGACVRLAARVVDVKAGGNPANIGDCSCACACNPPKGEICEHDRACPHEGAAEDSQEVSERLRVFMAHFPTLREAFAHGVDAVYAAAGLTKGELEVTRYKHEGLSHTSIAFLTGRQEGTCFALYSRAKFKLRELATERAVAA